MTDPVDVSTLRGALVRLQSDLKSERALTRNLEEELQGAENDNQLLHKQIAALKQ